ncbi:MAG: hypothetical protein JEZ00_14280 [Anaerolineaceae bacterium]|nr:hypothetical protein [Anaerolineaceae bacterium]
MIDMKCVPYKRKGLYLALTLPMIVIYILIFCMLWQIKPMFALIYLSFFVLVALCMSFVCVYWQCPYVGKFAPCVGGFCLPSSQLARLWKNTKRTEGRYKFFYNAAFVFFFAIIFFPLYFLYMTSIPLLIGYIVVVSLYTVSYMWLICPHCATRAACPGGQSAMALQKWIKKSELDEEEAQ